MSLTWREYAADEPRFIGLDGALLLGPGGTNIVANARPEGFVVGSPGTLPTGWTTPAAQTGVTHVFSAVARNGASGLGISFTGTATNAAATGFETSARTSGIAPVATGSQVRTVAALLWLDSGGLTNIADVNLGGTSINSGGTATPQAGTNIVLQITSVPQLFHQVLTTASDADRFVARMNISVADGASSDAVIGVAWVNDRVGDVRLNPILPPVGSPATTTEGADLLSASLATLGVGANGASTWWFDFTMTAPVGAEVVALCLDDGTLDNRMTFGRSAAGQGVLGRVTGGTPATQTLGAVVTGTRYGAAVTVDGSGNVRASIHTLSAGDVTGAPISGLTTSRLNGVSDGSLASHRRVRRIQYLPYAVGNATLDVLAANAAAW